MLLVPVCGVCVGVIGNIGYCSTKTKLNWTEWCYLSGATWRDDDGELNMNLSNGFTLIIQLYDSGDPLGTVLDT